MVQTGSFLYVTIYHYGQGGSPTWFGGRLNPGAGQFFTGTLYTVTDPYYGGAFNPASVTATAAGTITFTPTSVDSGVLASTINGVTVTRTIQRQPLTLDNYNGVYGAVLTQTTTGCNNAASNGSGITAIAVQVSQNGSAMTFATQNASVANLIARRC